MTQLQVSCIDSVQRPRSPATTDPNNWSRPQVLAGWLWPEFIEVASTRRPLSWDFPTVTAALNHFLAVSPGHGATPANGRPDFSPRPR